MVVIMEQYFVRSVLDTIYGYMSWFELKQYPNVPDYIWRRICHYYCTDYDFKKAFDTWFDILRLPWREIFLYLINFSLKIEIRNRSCIPEILWNDRYFVGLKVKNQGSILKWVNNVFRMDRSIVYHAVKQYGFALSWTHDIFKNDREIVLEAVKNDGCALKFAFRELRANREIVLEAVKKAGFMLQFASPELRADPEIVYMAVKNNKGSFQFVNPSMETYRHLAFDMIKKQYFFVYPF